MIYETKKDLLYSIIIYGSFILLTFMLYQMIVDHLWYATIFPIIFNAFLAWVWFGTKYVIDNGNLYIQFGPWKRTIPIEQINSVRFAKNPLSSAALALERIEINYSNYKSIQISPENRETFIKHLQQIKPSLDVIK